MLRPLALILLAMVSACASQRPYAPVGPPAADTVEPVDPAIRPLAQEEEEAAR